MFGIKKLKKTIKDQSELLLVHDKAIRKQQEVIDALLVLMKDIYDTSSNLNSNPEQDGTVH